MCDYKEMHVMDLKRNIKVDNNLLLINFINLSDIEREKVRLWRNNEIIMKWMYQDHLISFEEHSIFINKLISDNNNFYWMIKKNTVDYIGVISLNKIDFRNKNAYFGIYSNPDSKLSGVGGLLIECLKKLAFKIANLHTLKLEVIESNKRAIDFYKKSGFIEEGRLKEFVFKDGNWQDVIVMGIIIRNGV